MPQLPWVVAPTIRTREVTATVDGQDCTLVFPVLGCLKNRELVHIREHEYQAVVNRESSRLADALVGEGIEETQAQRIAIRIISTRMGIPIGLEPLEQRAMLRHAALIADLTCEIQDAFALQRLRTITAVVASRLEGCGAWTDADTSELPEPVLDAVFAFASDERTANQPPQSPEEIVEGMIETLGKFAPEPDPSPPTGPASTGDAAGSGPMLPSSPPTASESSASPTPSKRSKKASAG